MMKKSLTQAIALAASLGAAASAHAVNVNQDGLGQVLIYPVYSTVAGNDTYISVTNTTDQFKAVKVRFLEGQASREVLDFNLYLSPYDVWNAAVVRTEGGAKIVTGDTSCTAPAIPAAGIEFRGFEYGNGLLAGERGRVGYVEIIEMGEIDPTLVLAPSAVTAGVAIKHVPNAQGNYVPGNCAAVRGAWNAGGVWASDNNAGIDDPQGGLYGLGTIINVAKGTEIGYDAVALDNFWGEDAGGQHTSTGSLFPNIDQGTITATFKNGVTADFASGAAAVSAVLMKESLMNDFAVGAGLNAQTEWVINFPTRRQFGDGTIAPFTGSAGTGCQSFDAYVWDREEREPTTPITDIDFSPLPPPEEVQSASLCRELNLVGINGSQILAPSSNALHYNLNLESYSTGWLQLDFTGTGRELVGDETLEGLPMVGFAITEIVNENVVDGVLANYAGAWNHKAVTTLDRPN